MTGSIFSQLPNDIIMKIIKMNREEELKQEAKNKFEDCMYEMKFLPYVYHYDPYDDVEFEKWFRDEKAEYYLIGASVSKFV